MISFKRGLPLVAGKVWPPAPNTNVIANPGAEDVTSSPLGSAQIGPVTTAQRGSVTELLQQARHGTVPATPGLIMTRRRACSCSRLLRSCQGARVPCEVACGGLRARETAASRDHLPDADPRLSRARLPQDYAR